MYYPIILGFIAGTCFYHGFKGNHPISMFSGILAVILAVKLGGFF